MAQGQKEKRKPQKSKVRYLPGILVFGVAHSISFEGRFWWRKALILSYR
jgi:hypothetical protein